MLFFVYNIGIKAYGLAIRITSLFNPKAKLWVSGRKKQFEFLETNIETSKPRIWFHCSSLGEFEQGKPLIEAYRKAFPDHFLLLSFFSPSGYEIRKNYDQVDLVFYLPLDTQRNAQRLLSIIRPEKVFFIKYEFWFNLLRELKNQHIKTYLVSGIFRKEQHFFKPYGRWFRTQLKNLTYFFLQDKNSVELLQKIGFNNLSLTGDTRFDTVVKTAKNIQPIPKIELFYSKEKTLIIGSSWEKDIEILKNWIEQSNWKVIIAPHQISADKMKDLQQSFNRPALLYSNSNNKTLKEADILIIDSIGLLSKVYQYGSIAYIGGGFGSGIHNILEAATFGLPIIFGPNYHRFKEANDLIHLKGAASIRNPSELEQTMNQLMDTGNRKEKEHIIKNYIQENTGAVEKIIQFLKSEN